MTEAKPSGIPSLATPTFDSWEQTIRGHCMQHRLIKFFKPSVAPVDPVALATYKANHTKAAGIFIQYMGDDNFNRLKVSQPLSDREDLAVIWKFLTNHYQSTTSNNQSKVYHEYNLFAFRTDLDTFLQDLDKHLGHLSSVGFVIGEPTGAVIKEAIFAKSIIDKLPDKFDTVKDLLWAQRPLTIKKVRDTLQNKSRNTTSTSSSGHTISIKAEDTALSAEKPKRTWCQPGYHSPTSTTHTKQECRQLKAKKAVAPSQDKDNESIATADGLRCTARTSIVLEKSELVYLDSGASHHMFPNKSIFVDYFPQKSRVEIADGTALAVVGQGFVEIIADNSKVVKLKALHVPKLNAPLVSLGRLLKHKCVITHCTTKGFHVSQDGEVIMTAKMINSTAQILLKFAHQGQSANSIALKTTSADVELLHRQSGHPNAEAMKHFFNITSPHLHCKVCPLAKSHRLPFPSLLPDAV
jgi:hypothetical protein